MPRERESKRLRHIYNNIISIENLLISWREFLRGKRKRKDVAEFSLYFMDNLAVLHKELAEKTYRHGRYLAFKINDPKSRDIHKASVRDRLLHHAICRILYPYFDRKFIYDSYSCRIDKGTHRATNRFREYGRIVSQNHTRTVWVLKGDIKKFFASIDHVALKDILEKYIKDADALWLLEQVIDSFHTKNKFGTGLPLGNLTSQLLVNIYMNEFDQFAKRELKARYYIRYADDFVILSPNKQWLKKLIPQMILFLQERLKLAFHPDKTFIKTLVSGVDFLGWVHFPYYRVLRTATKRRMLARMREHPTVETSASYLGLLKHGNTFDLRQEVIFYFDSLKNQSKDDLGLQMKK